VVRTWIFQSNPQKFNIDDELFNKEEIEWTAKVYKDNIKTGDRAFIWRADGGVKGSGGIVALGSIKHNSHHDNIIKNSGCEITIKIEEYRPNKADGMLPKEKLEKMTELKNIDIVKCPNGSIFKVKNDEAALLESLWFKRHYSQSSYKMKIANLNSRVTKVDADLEKYCIKRMGYLKTGIDFDSPLFQGRIIKPWDDTNVYLVDEELMDIISPPEKRYMLNLECVKDFIINRLKVFHQENDDRPIIQRILERINESPQNVKHLWEEINRREYFTTTKPMGVYFRSLGITMINNIKGYLRQKGNTYIDIEEKSSIFICPERVEKWAGKEKLFNIAFADVLMHELAHAFTDIDMNVYRTDWGKVIEESLANIIAYNRFSHLEKSSLRPLISKQPVEYKVCTYWLRLDEDMIKEIALAWSENRPDVAFDLIKEPNIKRNILFQDIFDYNEEYWVQLGFIILCKTIFSD